MQRVLSGIQPTGIPHIGNYFGALKQWIALQESHQVFYSIVDLHAITVPRSPDTLRKQTREMATCLLACGLDPTKSTIFRQSRVSQHTYLAWILFCRTNMSWLQRMHHYKVGGHQLLDIENC